MQDEKRYLETEQQEIFLKPEYTSPFILDIGGGGEGFIGKLYGKKVVAIDRLKSELLETDNDALKIVMDGTDLQFLDCSFEVVTLFYSLMYMMNEVKTKVLEEAYRVLKPEGILEIWDMIIPEYDGSEKDIVIGRLKVHCNHETIETGYGSIMAGKEQTSESLEKIILDIGYKSKLKEINGISFRLQYTK